MAPACLRPLWRAWGACLLGAENNVPALWEAAGGRGYRYGGAIGKSYASRDLIVRGPAWMSRAFAAERMASPVRAALDALAAPPSRLSRMRLSWHERGMPWLPASLIV